MTSHSPSHDETTDVADDPPTEPSERLFAVLSSADRTRGGVIGLVAGGLATVAMSAFRTPVSRSPPPPAWFWAEYVAGGDPSDYWVPGAVLHLFYGTVAGGAFGLLAGGSRSDGQTGDRTRETSGRTTLLGLLYGAALSGFGVAVLMRRVLRLDLARDERFVFHLAHLVYGLTLGAWFGTVDDGG